MPDTRERVLTVAAGVGGLAVAALAGLLVLVLGALGRDFGGDGRLPPATWLVAAVGLAALVGVVALAYRTKTALVLLIAASAAALALAYVRTPVLVFLTVTTASQVALLVQHTSLARRRTARWFVAVGVALAFASWTVTVGLGHNNVWGADTGSTPPALALALSVLVAGVVGFGGRRSDAPAPEGVSDPVAIGP